MSDRLTPEQVQNVLAWYGPYIGTPSAPDPHEEVIAALATEVLASRKLIADLRALHRQSETTSEMRWNGAQHKHVCVACAILWPCPTIQLIEGAGL